MGSTKRDGHSGQRQRHGKELFVYCSGLTTVRKWKKIKQNVGTDVEINSPHLCTVDARNKQLVYRHGRWRRSAWRQMLQHDSFTTVWCIDYLCTHPGSLLPPSSSPFRCVTAPYLVDKHADAADPLSHPLTSEKRQKAQFHLVVVHWNTLFIRALGICSIASLDFYKQSVRNSCCGIRIKCRWCWLF